MKRVAIVLMTFLIFISVGCDSMHPGINRTSFNKWQTSCYPKLGLSLELPAAGKNAPRVSVSTDDTFSEMVKAKSLFVKMHFNWAGCLWAESVPMVSIGIYRFGPAEYENYTKGQHPLFGDKIVRSDVFDKFNSNLVWKEVKRQIPQETVFLHCRKDYKAPNGDVILTGAEIWSALLDSSDNLKIEDRKAVERILNSIQFLSDDKGKK